MMLSRLSGGRQELWGRHFALVEMFVDARVETRVQSQRVVAFRKAAGFEARWGDGAARLHWLVGCLTVPQSSGLKPQVFFKTVGQL